MAMSIEAVRYMSDDITEQQKPELVKSVSDPVRDAQIRYRHTNKLDVKPLNDDQFKKFIEQEFEHPLILALRHAKD